MLGEKLDAHSARDGLARQHGLDGRAVRRGPADADRRRRGRCSTRRSPAISTASSIRVDPTFGFEVPVAVPGVDAALLDPRSTWADPDAYDAKAAELARMFRENFTRFDDVAPGVAAAGPRSRHHRAYLVRAARFLRRLHTRAAISGRVARPLTRRFAVLLSRRAPALALAGGCRRGRAALGFARARLRGALGGRRARRSARTALAQAAITWRGGPITTSTGETVDVRVSDALPLETSTPEGWAEFLTRPDARPRDLAADDVHRHVRRDPGDLRLAGARLLRPQRDGRASASCAGGHRARRRSSATSTATTSPSTGSTRRGPRSTGGRSGGRAPPTSARGSPAGRRFPGDGGSNYSRNPGEAWAEVYRLMDERKAGITTATWPIIEQSFYPSEAALQAAELDVLQPWTTPSTTVSTRVFGKRTAKVWWIPLSTPLDGDLRISATMPRGGTHEVALVACRSAHGRPARAVGRPAGQAARRHGLRPALAVRPGDADRRPRTRAGVGDDAVTRPGSCRAGARGDGARDGREHAHGNDDRAEHHR